MTTPRDWKKMTPDEIFDMSVEEHEAIDDPVYHGVFLRLATNRGYEVPSEILKEHSAVFTKLGQIDNKEPE